MTSSPHFAKLCGFFLVNMIDLGYPKSQHTQKITMQYIIFEDQGYTHFFPLPLAIDYLRESGADLSSPSPPIEEVVDYFSALYGHADTMVSRFPLAIAATKDRVTKEWIPAPYCQVPSLPKSPG